METFLCCTHELTKCNLKLSLFFHMVYIFYTLFRFCIKINLRVPLALSLRVHIYYKVKDSTTAITTTESALPNTHYRYCEMAAE
jgi:hypothetical protein